MKNNLVIKASAGTGKTFAIATQVIRILVFGEGKVRPETILGLTFSRAAAQEIYEKILNRLRDAASSEKGAAEEKDILLSGLDNAEMAMAEKMDFTQDTFTKILRRVIDAQGHGTIATLDSFIQKIVQKFPLELGFQKSLSVLDDYGRESAEKNAIADIMSATDDPENMLQTISVSQNDDAIRSGITKMNALTDGIDSWIQFLRDHPESRNWTAESMANALGIEPKPIKPDLSVITVGEREQPFLDEIKEYIDSFNGNTLLIPKNQTGKILAYFFNDPTATCFDFTYGRGKNNQYHFDCGARGAEVLRAAIRYLGAVALNRKLNVAAAKLRLCEAIEARYDAAARRNGMLTFSDFTDCLAGKEGEGGKVGYFKDTKEWLLNLQFRLDSQFAHWALDEFQDTSTAQWKCLQPLVEAAISDGASDGERSVLAVGDLKQSIYRWRGGCNKPFEDIEKEVTENEGAVQTLAKSYRYGKKTAEFVDKVFGPENVKALAGSACEEAVGKWETQCWPHDGHQAKNDGDYVEIIGVPNAGDSDEGSGSADDEEDNFKPSAAMRSIAPRLCEYVRDIWEKHEDERADAEKSGKHFTTDGIGILVRNNKDGLYLAERLRKMDTKFKKTIPVVWEGTSGVLDSPIVRAVLELLQLAEHPGDKFSWAVVNTVFPLRETVYPNLHSAPGVSAAVAESLSKHGLARTLEQIVSALKSSSKKLDLRTSMRLDQLVRESAKFEERPDGGDIAGFRNYLESVSDREIASSPDVVRILTIHRSKGLTIDHVFVPVTSADDLLVPKPTARVTGNGWVVDSLGRDLARVYPMTQAAFDEAANGHLLDELCTWYVALTRAVKSTHVFYVDDGNGEKTQFSDLLCRPFPADKIQPCKYGTLRHLSGEPPSLVTVKNDVNKEDTASAPATVKWEHDGKRENIRHVTPSTTMLTHGKNSYVSVSDFFKETDGRADASQHGVEEHSAFAEIEWINPADPQSDREKTILDWDDTWKKAFTKISDTDVVWREKSYELLIDNPVDSTWETGQFDRVVFRGEGENRKAEIYDFKTNAMHSGETEQEFESRMKEKYAGQMDSYRKALAKLCGINEAQITTTLLLTATGTAKPVMG